jgi:hypothetical protein
MPQGSILLESRPPTLLESTVLLSQPSPEDLFDVAEKDQLSFLLRLFSAVLALVSPQSPSGNDFLPFIVGKLQQSGSVTRLFLNETVTSCIC